MWEYLSRSLTPLGQIDRDQYVVQGLPVARLASIPAMSVLFGRPFFDRDIAVLSPSVVYVNSPDFEIRFLTDAESSAAFAERIGKRGVTKEGVRVDAILDFIIPSAERRQISVSCVVSSSHLSSRHIIPAVAAVSKRCSFWHECPITALYPREARHRIRGSSAMPVFATVEASLYLLTEMPVVAGRVRIPGGVVRSHATTVSAKTAAARCLSLTADTRREATACHKGSRL